MKTFATCILMAGYLMAAIKSASPQLISPAMNRAATQYREMSKNDEYIRYIAKHAKEPDPFRATRKAREKVMTAIMSREGSDSKYWQADQRLYLLTQLDRLLVFEMFAAPRGNPQALTERFTTCSALLTVSLDLGKFQGWKGGEHQEDVCLDVANEASLAEVKTASKAFINTLIEKWSREVESHE